VDKDYIAHLESLEKHYSERGVAYEVCPNPPSLLHFDFDDHTEGRSNSLTKRSKRAMSKSKEGVWTWTFIHFPGGH
jgi:hypothetical protein